MDKRMMRTMAFLSRHLDIRTLVRASGQKVIFPFWHVFSDRKLPHIMHLYPYPDEDRFEADLDSLLRVFTPLSIEDYLKLDPGTVPKGKPAMVLSFDDGLSQCHSVIAPILKRKGIPAVFFLNNDFIDNRGLFYRYKASALVEHLSADKKMLAEAAEFLAIPDYQVRDALMMVNYRQGPLLDAVALQVELDWAVYMRDYPVYMSTEQIRHLLDLGFHVGAHSTDHPEFNLMEEKQMEAAVGLSMRGISTEFRVRPLCFAFPFTSDGVPAGVIDGLLEDGVADILLGTSGLKRTGRMAFRQRIPMEHGELDARGVLKAEYIYYLFKGLLGRNKYFRD